MQKTKNELQRLQKVLADTGRWSRREAEELIQEGAVTVNGQVAKLGVKVDFSKDHIKVLGKRLHFKKFRDVYAVFKPRGILSQRPADQAVERGTIFEFLPEIRSRLIVVGRLDSNAEGLMLVTNDGDLAARLNSGRYEIPKVYLVKIDGHLSPLQLRRLRYGVKVEERKVVPLEVEIKRETEGKEWVQLALTHPGHRIVKKLFESVGHPVDKIKRVAIGPIDIKGLERGLFRKLSEVEVKKLCKLVSLD